jgi:hypothetical protein
MVAQSRIVARVTGSIEWHVDEAGPVDFPIAAFPGWHLLNPLHWTLDERVSADVQVLGKLDSRISLSSEGLVLVTENEDDTEFPFKLNVISEVLRRLRYVARQFALPQQVAAVVHQKPGASSTPIAVARDDFSRLMVRNYRMPTALTEDHVRQVAAMAADFAVPVHAEVLLDALEAHVEEDFRKALLYGAIAVEAYARLRLEDQAALNVAHADARHRAASLPVAGRKLLTKDPVADFLLQGDSFGRLLHEAPLYISGRSLLLEKPDTYREVLRLYATRNKIAHLGLHRTSKASFLPIGMVLAPRSWQPSRQLSGLEIPVLTLFGMVASYRPQAEMAVALLALATPRRTRRS